MKKMIKSANTYENVSQCIFTFDLGRNYDDIELENSLTDIFIEHGCDPGSIDFQYVRYARKTVSQCTVDFIWSDDYDSAKIGDDIADLITGLGGDLYEVEFYPFT